MSNQVMVIVSGLANDKHAEINVIEGVQKAARLVETLLEAGFDQARMRVFVGGEMGMQVRHRPVVALVADDEGSKSAPAHGVGKSAATSDTEAESPNMKSLRSCTNKTAGASRPHSASHKGVSPKPRLNPIT